MEGYMVTVDPGRQTRIVNIKDRQVVVRQLLDAQYGLMAREASTLKRAVANQDSTRVQRSTDLLMRTIASAIVQEDDRDYVDDLVAAGELELDDLKVILSVFNTDDQTEPTKPQVRRGRPTKRT
jgi:hypothetical protein